MLVPNNSLIELREQLDEPSFKLFVASLGPSGVGKTCLLAAMLKYFRDQISRTDFKVETDEESYGTIKAHEEGLEELVRDFDAVDKGPTSTEDEVNIRFRITRDKWRSRANSLGIEFFDISGGWLQEDSSSTKYQRYFKQVKNSAVVIIPIDTLALMEEGGKFHEEINKPQLTTRMIATVYENLPKDEERLVLFVPVKCETYVRKPKDMERLVEEVKKGYAELINKVLSPKSNQVAVAITPVQTVGCVVYGGTDIDLDTNKWKGWFLNKTRADAPMESQWVDQPLRYILRFLIYQYLEKRQGGIFGKINDYLGANKDMYNALRSFSQGRITSPPFEIIQGHDLLKF